MQSISSARSASPGRRGHRALGQHLAEEDDVGFDRPAAGGADRDAVLVEELVDLLDARRRRRSCVQEEVSIEPCTSTTFSRARRRDGGGRCSG